MDMSAPGGRTGMSALLRHTAVTSDVCFSRIIGSDRPRVKVPRLTELRHWPRPTAMLPDAGFGPIQVIYLVARWHLPSLGSDMFRRDFITLLGGAAVVWPLTAWAQQPMKLPTIGFLGPLTPSSQSEWTDAFVQSTRAHGWIEGRTVAIEYRWGEGRSERLTEIVAEFVRLKVNVIVTAGTEAVIAAKQTTSVIPLVFGQAGDPVGTGLVASLGRPGANVTGLSNQPAGLAAKRI